MEFPLPNSKQLPGRVLPFSYSGSVGGLKFSDRRPQFVEEMVKSVVSLPLDRVPDTTRDRVVFEVHPPRSLLPREKDPDS